MHVVLRFFDNPDRSNPNALISRTLGKICFIHNAYKGPKPRHGEFWISDIAIETRSGQVGGCFLCEPFQPVAYEELVPLSPLSCTVNPPRSGVITVDPVRLETPDGRKIPWILTLNHKNRLITKDIVAAIVNLGGSWWEAK